MTCWRLKMGSSFQLSCGHVALTSENARWSVKVSPESNESSLQPATPAQSSWNVVASGIANLYSLFIVNRCRATSTVEILLRFRDTNLELLPVSINLKWVNESVQLRCERSVAAIQSAFE